MQLYFVRTWIRTSFTINMRNCTSLISQLFHWIVMWKKICFLHWDKTKIPSTNTSVFRVYKDQFMCLQFFLGRSHYAHKHLLYFDYVLLIFINQIKILERMYSQLFNKRACSLILFKKKIYPNRSYLRAFCRQAAPNFAYSFIEFEERLQPTRLLESIQNCLESKKV